MSHLRRPPAGGWTERMAGSGSRAPASASRRSTFNPSRSASGAASRVVPVGGLSDGEPCPGGAGGVIFGGSWPAGAESGAARGVVPIDALAGVVSCPGGVGGGVSGGSWPASSSTSCADHFSSLKGRKPHCELVKNINSNNPCRCRSR